MHRKEEAIFPVFDECLGLRGKVLENANTDLLGTFTGEIPRNAGPLETLKQKCRNWLSLATEHDLIVATEGSFGPHPHLFFIPAHQELIHLIDLKNNWEITESIISTETNFARSVVHSEKELIEFAEKAGFPEHGIIIRTGNPEVPYYKGIHDEAKLISAYNEAMISGKSVEVETDMRALHNPKRMKVISLLAEKLCKRLLCTCPECNLPGFGFVEPVYGLACELCGNETNELKYELHGCVRCNFKKQVVPNGGKSFADAGNCPFCNP